MGVFDHRGVSMEKDEEVAPARFEFAQYLHDESLFWSHNLELAVWGAEQTTGDPHSSLHFADYSAHWCLLYAKWADPREEIRMEESVWWKALAKKLWMGGDVFQRVWYFIGQRLLAMVHRVRIGKETDRNFMSFAKTVASPSNGSISPQPAFHLPIHSTSPLLHLDIKQEKDRRHRHSPAIPPTYITYTSWSRAE
jgi:hypothetical protein